MSVLGKGEELIQSAFSLCELALYSASIDEMMTHAEEAWNIVNKSAGYLLFNFQSRERESWHALHLALAFSNRLEKQPSPIAGVAFTLAGKQAREIEKWFVRSQQPRTRLLNARLSRPKKVSAQHWNDWGKAIGSNDYKQVAQALERIRMDVPDFLIEQQGNALPSFHYVPFLSGGTGETTQGSEPHRGEPSNKNGQEDQAHKFDQSFSDDDIPF